MNLENDELNENEAKENISTEKAITEENVANVDKQTNDTKEKTSKFFNKNFIIFIILLLIAIIILFCLNSKKDKDVETITTLGKIELINLNQNGEPVSGEKFALKDSEGKTLGEVESGTDGKVMFYSVPVGDYVLEVVENAEGYVPQENTKNVTVNGGEQTQITFANNWQYGILNITVVDDANNPIVGAEIEVCDEEGYSVGKINTDESGKAFKDLNNGVYFFKQIAESEIYAIDATLYKVIIDDNNKTFYKTVTNERFKGNFLIALTDSNNQPVNGVEYNLLDKNKENITTITTNEKGLAGAKNLPLGTYYYQEKNLEYDSEIHEFKIEEKEQIVRKDIIIDKK